MPAPQLFRTATVPVASLMIEAAVLTLITLGWVLTPIAYTLLSGNPRFVLRYRQSLIQSWRMIGSLRRARVIRRNASRKIGAKPAVRIEGQCIHCGRCCIDRNCVFLQWNDQGESRCGIYGNWFWRLTSCGQYPVAAEDISVYQCPTFKAIPIRVIAEKPEADR